MELWYHYQQNHLSSFVLKQMGLKKPNSYFLTDEYQMKSFATQRSDLITDQIINEMKILPLTTGKNIGISEWRLFPIPEFDHQTDQQLNCEIQDLKIISKVRLNTETYLHSLRNQADNAGLQKLSECHSVSQLPMSQFYKYV